MAVRPVEISRQQMMLKLRNGRRNIKHSCSCFLPCYLVLTAQADSEQFRTERIIWLFLLVQFEIEEKFANQSPSHLQAVCENANYSLGLQRL